MYRTKLNDLNYWFKQENRKPLIIRGARQVGKSTLVKIFAQQNGSELLEINFERNPGYAEFFKNNNPFEIINLLEISFNCTITKNTILFLDEIQAEPQVLKCLRYFYEEAPNFPIIAAGSLLDFELNTPSFSIPVGRISYMYLQPMGFTEYLIADGKKKLAKFIENYKVNEEINNAIHDKLINEFKKFMAIGGMPEAVKIYTQTKSYKKTEEVKQDLLATFHNDFAKYSKQHQYKLIRKVFAQITQNLGNKIKYSNLSSDNKAADVASVIELLDAARVVKKVIRSSSNGVPIAAQENAKFFKIIFLDVGLVSTQLNLGIKMLNTDDVLLVNNGELAEQWVGQALLLNSSYSKLPELHYWAREKKSSSAEVDYVIANQDRVIAIEVNAGKTGSLKSLHLFMQEKNSKLGVRFNSAKPSYYEKGKILSLPLYLAERTQKLIEQKLEL